MTDSATMRHALRQFWVTHRKTLVPELTTALAKDRAKRAEASMLRLVAGYELLPALQAEYLPRYQALLQEAQGLARTADIEPEIIPSGAESGVDHPVFVGVPVVAGKLEALISALQKASVTRPTIGPSLDRLIAGVCSCEAACRSDYERRVLALAEPTQAEAAGQELTVNSLQRYLRAHSLGSPDIVVASVNEVPGGRSKRTVLVALSPCGALPPEIVLRIDTGRNVENSVTGEFPLLDRVAKRGMPVPEPLWLESSTTHFGSAFIVFRRMPGASAGDLIEGAFCKEPATALTLARVLARIHADSVALLETPAERGSAVPHTHELLSHYFNAWRRAKPFPSLVIETAFMWLFRRINDGLGEATVVQADTGFHNLLIDAHGNGCLLDWEFAHFGDPAEDLASCRPAVTQCMRWNDFLEEYQVNGGKPVSEFRLQYFEIWRPLRNAVLCGGVLNALMRGPADDIDPVTIALSTFVRLQADLANSLDRIVRATN